MTFVLPRRQRSLGALIALAATLGTPLRPARADEAVAGTAPPETANVPVADPEAKPDDPAPKDGPATPPPKPRPVVGLRVDGGYSPRTIVELPLTGADVGLAVGAQPLPHAAFWGGARLFLGSTENGLDVFSGRFGGEVEAVVDRLRIGAGLNLFLVGVSRAIRDETILSWGPAILANARFDLIQSSGFSLFARAAVDAGVEIYASTGFLGATLGGGVDFDLAGDRSSLK